MESQRLRHAIVGNASRLRALILHDVQLYRVRTLYNSPLDFMMNQIKALQESSWENNPED